MVELRKETKRKARGILRKKYMKCDRQWQGEVRESKLRERNGSRGTRNIYRQGNEASYSKVRKGERSKIREDETVR